MVQFSCVTIALASGALVVPSFLWSAPAPVEEEEALNLMEMIEDPFCFQIDGEELSLFEFLGLDELDIDSEE